MKRILGLKVNWYYELQLMQLNLSRRKVHELPSTAWSQGSLWSLSVPKWRCLSEPFQWSIGIRAIEVERIELRSKNAKMLYHASGLSPAKPNGERERSVDHGRWLLSHGVLGKRSNDGYGLLE